MMNLQQDPIQTDAAISYHAVPLDSLESLRLRLTQITHTLTKLSTELKGSQQLPSWSSIQSQLTIILTQLRSLALSLDEHTGILETAVVYPLPSFPTTEQEGLLTTLMRKKLSPEVMEWIEDAKKVNEGGEKLTFTEEDQIIRFSLREVGRLLEQFDVLKNQQEAELRQSGQIKDISGVKENLSGGGSISTIANSSLMDEVLKFMFQGITPEEQRIIKQNELKNRMVNRKR